MSVDLQILKTLITDKKYANEFVNDYNEQLLDPDYWKIAKIIIPYIKLYKEPPTLNVILDRMVKSDDKAKASLTEAWNKIEAVEANPKEFRYNLDKLKRRSAEQEILNVKNILNQQEPGKVDIKSSLQELKKSIQQISDLDKKKTFTRKTIKDAVVQFKQTYKERKKNPAAQFGIKSGYSKLDEATSGFIGGDLLVVAGESSTGKSLVLSNLAAQIYLQNNTITDREFTPGQDILYFSLEMPFESCFNRLLARLASVNSKKLRSAKLNAEEMARVKTALDFMEAYPHQFEIIDMPSGASIENIEAVYQDALSYSSPSVIVIDYLGLMAYDDDSMDDWLKLGKIAEVTHEFARSNNVTVLSAVQLNRAKASSKDPEDLIGLHRIGRSALIATHVTHLLQIVKRPQEKQLKDMHLALIKNREGDCPDFKLLKDLKNSTVLDIEQTSDSGMEFFDEDDISEQFDALDDF
jgi:replicative DNA helicase